MQLTKVSLSRSLRAAMMDWPAVNILKGKLWDQAASFDAEKDKSKFRRYDDACERVRSFYTEQHGADGSCKLRAGRLIYVQKSRRWSSISTCVSTCARQCALGWVRIMMLLLPTSLNHTVQAYGRPWNYSIRSWTSRIPMHAEFPDFARSFSLISLVRQTQLTQIEHLLQTAEAIRRDGKPEWMQVTGLVHDLGKLLYIFGSECV